MKTTITTILLGCCCMAAAQNFQPKYELISAEGFPTADVAVATCNVLDYGADPTGQKDCTELFQQLLDQLAGVGTVSGSRGHYANPTGGILYLPAGTYLLKSQLTIPRGVTMRGDWRQPAPGQPLQGTVLAIEPARYQYGKTNTAFSAIVMQPSTELSHLAFWYPKQQATAVTAFPPTVLYGESGYWGNDYCNVRHCTFVNSYIGIQFNDGNGGGCPNIFDVWGSPLYQGVVMDAIADVGRFDGLHFAPWVWAGSGFDGAPSLADVRQWTRHQATGFVMRRNDWSYTCNYECEGYDVAFRAEASPRDGSKPNGHCYNLRFTDCHQGIDLQGVSYCGYLFAQVNTTGCGIGVHLQGGGDGPAQFYGGTLSGTRQAVLIESAASSSLMLQECRVEGPAMALGGELVSSGSTYTDEVVINPTARTLFCGNQFEGSGRLTNNSLFHCEVSDSRLATRPLPVYQAAWLEPRATEPAARRLWVVTSAPYQAKPVDITVDLSTVPDQSASIQQALNDAGAAGGGIVYLPSGHYRIDAPLTIPAGVELKGSADLASIPRGQGAVLEVMTGEGEATGTPFITMAPGSGLRGLSINYPRQTDPKNVKVYPYTVRGNADCYIVNLGLRAAYRGVDLFTEKCDRHYVDYLAGHCFQNVIRIGGNAEDGTVTNIQCNTIAYACGHESKYGGWPNSADANNAPSYGQNMEDLDFMVVGDCRRQVLYNNFLFGCNKGMLFQDDGQGGAADVRALGNAVDGAVQTFVVEGIATNLDMVNAQVVALNHDDKIIRSRQDACFITMGPKLAGRQVTFFGSDHWGSGNYFGRIQSGTLNLYLAQFDQSGAVSTFQVSEGARVNITTSRIKTMTRFAGLSGTERRVGVEATVLDLEGATQSSFAHWAYNLGKSWTLSTTTAFLSRSGWTATASVNSGNARRAIDGDASTRWDTSGSQHSGQWFSVDMKQPQTFNTVLLDASGSPADGPAAYTLETSADGQQWTAVAQGQNGGAMLFITFPEGATARHLRISQTGTKSNYWSIHELQVASLNLASGIQSPSGAATPLATRVYTLHGRLVGTSLAGLPHGIYIVVETSQGTVVRQRKVTL